MHSTSTPDKNVMFHFNSDFSGEVHLMIRKWEAQLEEHADHVIVKVPGSALEHFFAVMVEYKLGDIAEDISTLIIERLKENP